MKQLKLMLGIFIILCLFLNKSLAQTLPYTFQNSSRYADNEIYVGLVGQFPGMGNVWMDMTQSQLQVMSYSNNTVPGPAWANTPDGKNKYAAMFFKLSDIPNKTIQIPQGLFGCRILISFKSQMYIYFHQAGGYAGADLQNPTDPNDGIRWELVELTWGNAGLWTNTSRVDAYQYPMGLEVTGFTGGISGTYASSYNARVHDGSSPNVNKKIGELVSHQTILNAWTTKVETPFYGCKVLKTHSMDNEPIIEQASKIPDFKSNGAYKNYFDSYINDIWSTYSSKDLLINIGDRGTWRGRVTGNRFDFYDPADNSQATIYTKPTTQDAIEGAGALATTPMVAPNAKYFEDLMIQAQICAAINRHAIYTNAAVGEVQYNADASRFFKVAPFNQYVNFFHSTDISYQSQTYAFAYDDVGDQSSTIQCTFPTSVKVVIGGYGERMAEPISVPGKIEAEAFNTMFGIQTETSSDAGGGSNIGYIDTNDWVEYLIHASKTATYDFTFRSASLTNGGKLSVQIDGVTVPESITLPVTGGWQTWANTLLQSVSLTEGNHTLKIFFVDGAFNLNYIDVNEHVEGTSNFLHASGKNIVNNSGNFQIRAINIGNYMVQEGYMLNLGSGYQHVLKQKIADVVGTVNMEKFYDDYKANFLTKADIDSIAKWGFNTIRLPMHYNLFTQQGNPNVFIEKGFAAVDQIISWCKANNIYVILDLHAAPGGQNSGDISDYVAGQSSLWEDAAGSTYTSAQNRTQTIALWKEFARRYANEETVGGYDLINETNWTITNNTLLLNLMKDITTAIRSVDNNHILFIEGNSYANDYSGLTPKWDNNMAYSFHKYWNDVTDGSLDFIFRIRDEQNVPIWLGEFGENSNHWNRETVELMNKHAIGWAVWPYKKMGSVSAAVSFKEPANWTALATYFNGGAKPSAVTGQAILNELVENVKLRNCNINQGYLFALFANNINETKPFRYLTLPAKIQAAQYDEGKNGMAYSDMIYQTKQYGSAGGNYTAWNTGWYFRNDGVDIQYSNAEQTAIVGWAEENEWMNYTINTPASASYSIKARVAGMGGKLTLMVDGATVIDHASITSTGDWDSWSTVDLGLVHIAAGTHVLKIVISTAGFNLNYIDFNSFTPAITAETATSFCTGGNVTLNANTGTGYTYQWKVDGNSISGATNASYIASQSGSYTVSITANSETFTSATATVVTVNKVPTAKITASGATAFCTGGSVTLTSSTGSSYVWKNGITQVGTGSSYTATTAGSYTVEVTNAGNCSATSAATTVTVNAAPTATITASGATTFCTGGSVVLTASAGSSYVWKNGTTQVGTSASYKATTAGSYTVEVTNAGNCKATSTATTVIVNAAPTATITANGPTAIPQGGSVVLTASAGSSYVWYKGSTQVGTAQTYTATAAGAYTVEVTNSSNCSATSAATDVSINTNQPSLITITSPAANATITGAIDISVNVTDADGNIVLVEYLDGNTVIGTSTSAPYNFTWDNPSAGSHTITVRVTDSNGGITTSAPTVITSTAISTGVQSSNTLNANIYPNPSNGIVFIDSDTDLSGASFMLVDVMGNEHALSQTANGLGAQVDVSNLSDGAYILIIKKDNLVMRKKITVLF